MFPPAPAQNGQYNPQQNAAPIVPAQTQQMPIVQNQQQQFQGQPQQWQPQQQMPVQQQGQQFGVQQPQPQFTPPAPMMPLVAAPVAPAAQAAPVQQQQTQQQQQVSPYEQIYQNLARATGHPVETFRNAIKDDQAIMSAMLADALNNIRQTEGQRQQIPVQQPQQQQAQQSPDGKVAIPQAAYAGLKMGQNGLYEALSPAYQGYANAANQNLMIDQSRAQAFIADPTSVLRDPQFKTVMQQEIDKQVGERMKVQEVMSLRNSIKQKYQKEIALTDPTTGQIMINPQDIGKEDPRPLLTPLGTVFIDIANSLAKQGMRESADMYERAMQLARVQLGMFQPQQQQQQQQPQLQPGLYGQQNMNQAQGYGYQNQQVPMQQPMTQPSLSDLMQQQLQANSYYPGQAPARQMAMPSNMPLEGALMLALQDVPEGGDMNVYFNRLGPSLFN